MKIQSSACTLIFLLLSYGSTLHAQWSDNATENDTIVVGLGNQTAPVIISDGSGGIIVAWRDTRFNGSDIFAGRLDKSGNLPWQDSGVPVATAREDQEAPDMVSNGHGGAYITWQDSRAQGFGDIYAQEIEHLDGLARWQENGRIVQESSIRPSIIQDSIFGTIIASYATVVARALITVNRLGTNGDPDLALTNKLPSEDASVASTSSRQELISDSNGGAILAWADVRSGAGTELYAARLDQNGETPWPGGEVKLAATITSDTRPAIVADDEGGVIIVWISPEQPGSTNDLVRAQRLNAQGQAQWLAAGVVVSSVAASKRNVRIARTDEGVFVVVWEDLSTGPDRDIAAQRITSLGNVQGPLIDVVSETGAQSNPVVLANNRGGLLVAWEDNRLSTESDIYGQLIDASGGLTWGEGGMAVSTAANIQTKPVLTHDGLGGAVIAWQDFRSGVDFDIYSQRVSQSGALGEFRTITTTSPSATTSWEVGGTQLITWSFRGEIDSVSIELSRNGGASYFPADIVTEGAANTGSFSFVVSGDPSNNCRLRIRAVNNEHIQNLSPIFVIAPAASPSLQTNGVEQAVLDSALQVTAVSTDFSGIEEVTLLYQEGGVQTFVSTTMSRFGQDEFAATIPAASVSVRGLRYYISSMDSIGLETSSDTFNVAVAFESGTQIRLIASGSELTDYRMISAPNLLTQTVLDSIFATSGFGAYDTTSWRVFQYRDTSYVERDSLNALSFRFEPGEAFWLISESSHTIDFGAGVSQTANANHGITLHSGWNQIANPFAFPIAWEDILVASGDPNLSLPSTWRDSYVSPQQLDPFEGYFVHFFGDGDMTLVFPPIAFGESGSLAKGSVGPDWQIQISAQCGTARDNENYAGVDARASVEWDRLDQPEPPPFGDFVSVNFPHKGWSRFGMDYSSDYRPVLEDGQVWEFQVRTNQKNTQAVLSFSGLADVPPNINVLLLDERLHVRQDLRENPYYRFPTGSHGTAKALKLLVGDSEFLAAATGNLDLIPEIFELAQNFPNPFNPTTSIRFGLPSESQTTIQVYDLLGRRVRTLLANELLQAGFHLAFWDGRDDNSQPVASGVYVYRIVAGTFSQARKMVLVK